MWGLHEGLARAEEKQPSAASASGILTIKGSGIGKMLAFGRIGTYNPATGIKGLPPYRFYNLPFVPGTPESRPAFQSGTRMENGPAEYVYPEDLEARGTIFPKETNSETI
jgi:hypothetical protein